MSGAKGDVRRKECSLKKADRSASFCPAGDISPGSDIGSEDLQPKRLIISIINTNVLMEMISPNRSLPCFKCCSKNILSTSFPSNRSAKE
jgi:hypothetical protein